MFSGLAKLNGKVAELVAGTLASVRAEQPASRRVVVNGENMQITTSTGKPLACSYT